ncbi:MAG: tRNA (N6-isopentenyl adenosine(37)-C2)-methylthiotransferase MiaB [Clostridia bacterium]|nr:tRNA (N6-isopentenyl adenosine(37)-C2)-methylthiotransferase MiaB [Clostridia bacterium]
MNVVKNEDKERGIAMEQIRSIVCAGNITPKACVRTYGCQQNVADSERIKGMLSQMGYDFTEQTEEADLILFNTCAVREHAELKVYGNVGALKSLKAAKPEMLIIMCGCMMQQETVQNQIREKYAHVDIVFGPSMIPQLPMMMAQVLTERSRVFTRLELPEIAEDLPIVRDDAHKAWVSVMYGCNNFCTYCIVPYVRGRERSRSSAEIIKEIEELVASGYRDITLLGQNVNSYGKDLEGEMDFADLLAAIDRIEGNFWIRFTTSHPKDCSIKLLDTMASCKKVCHQLQLPFQSGSNKILKDMNRHYTAESYYDLIKYARKVMPDVVVTSDVIVGFPGETEEDFQATLDLVNKVQFDNLYTFLYSKRTGTKAALAENQVEESVKKERFNRLLALQHPVCLAKNQEMEGKDYPVYVESVSKNDSKVLSGKTMGGKTVDFPGSADLIGQFCTVTVTKAKSWSLEGKIKE